MVIKWLEEAGVDFFDISGGTYESPAWRGNIMKELTERPNQKERGRYMSPNKLASFPITNLPVPSYFVEWAQELKKVLVSKSWAMFRSFW